jgi:membrane protease YdiL (CAAX protease family)
MTLGVAPSAKTLTITAAPLHVSILLFLGSSLAFFLTLYILLPRLREANLTWFAVYNVVLVLPMLVLLVAALIGYKMEGHPFVWSLLQSRFRLQGMNTTTWLWTIALCVFMFGGRFSVAVTFAIALAAVLFEDQPIQSRLQLLGGLALFLLLSLGVWHTGPWLQYVRLHAEPAHVREFLEHFGSHEFMGIPLEGQWWVAVYYTLVLLCANIAGEELWWRGYLLPRQELVHGRFTWIVHGILWAAFHLFFQWTLWDFVRMLPTCCALSFVAQHRRNTWPGIIGHTFGNSAFLIQIVRGIHG